MSKPKSISQLDCYLVGGAVRDQLLNLSIYDRDWVVVGSTVAEMLSLGFTQVGKDFPVFLHPQTKEEYALARTEKKHRQGYTGFICDAQSSVTLTEDLLRRDLTINAIAMDESGEIFDPYQGKLDLENRVFRHVSQAFIEDPLRILRVARFAARFHNYQFSIASETLALMNEISLSGELKTLSGERVWQEMHRSLGGEHPEVFFNTLQKCGALKALWPELNALWGIPNPEKWHPEICSGLHTMMVLQQAVLLTPKTSVRFAAVCHDLGKTLTPREHWPSHKGHETSGLSLVENICVRLKVPKDHKSLALKVCQFHLHAHKALELKASTLINMFNKLDVWRKPKEFEDFLITCEADFKGRLGFENKAYPQRQYLRKALALALTVNAKTFIKQGVKGADIRSAIQINRIHLLDNLS